MFVVISQSWASSALAPPEGVYLQPFSHASLKRFRCTKPWGGLFERPADSTSCWLTSTIVQSGQLRINW
jgi:hypothetical protein